jgi:hypothetical protein
MPARVAGTKLWRMIKTAHDQDLAQKYFRGGAACKKQHGELQIIARPGRFIVSLKALA